MKSMTGFGRGEAELPGGKLQVEVKTLNHRFFEISMRLPENLLLFEDRIRAEVAKVIKRGKVNLSLTFEGKEKTAPKIIIDTALARKYKKLLSDLRRELGLKDDIGVSQIIAFPNVITVEPESKEWAKLWPNVKSALNKALCSLAKMRQEEAKSLGRDILRRKKTILRHISSIEKRLKPALKTYRAQLIKKIKEISTNKIELGKGRVELEVAIFAKNSDISEELTRIKAHLGNFEATMRNEDEVGRRLDFIAQELHREINTVGQKTSDYKISQHAIVIKGEVEKMREQVQNLE